LSGTPGVSRRLALRSHDSRTAALRLKKVHKREIMAGQEKDMARAQSPNSLKQPGTR
jgi:hypothetical protein